MALKILIKCGRIRYSMEFIKDMFLFIKERKKWWLAPVILVLLILGVLIVIGGGTAAAPFIYTIF